MGSRQDAKLEKKIKDLLRQPYNRRCVNCESLGPQYALPSFNIFVCTVCSGVHREFGHRVKGISVSRFTPEEAAALEEGGNGAFAAEYLATWQASTLPKPTNRVPAKIKEWIQVVFQEQRFRGPPKKASSPQQRAPSLGQEAKPALFKTPSAGRSPAPLSTSNGNGHAAAASPDSADRSNGDASHVIERRLSDVLGLSMPKLSVSEVHSPAASPAPATASSAEARLPAAAPERGSLLDLMSGFSPVGAQASGVHGEESSPWAAFDDDVGAGGPPAPTEHVPEPAEAPPQTAAAPLPSHETHGWEAFGEDAGKPAAAEQAPAPHTLPVPAPAATVPAPAAPPVPSPPPKPAPRPEVPLDVFYPEFDVIRATGRLPNGRPVPPPGYPVPSALGPGAHGAPAPAYNPAQAALAAQWGGVASPPRPGPTVLIPSPTRPGSSTPSPISSTYLVSSSGGGSVAGARFPPSTSSSLGSGAGHGWGQPVSTPAAGVPWYAAPAAPEGFPASASPVSSFPAPAAPTAPAPADVFSGLAAGARPAFPQAPPPAKALPPRPSSRNSDSAAHTLFGRSSSLYDLDAPQAPQPAPSGNPFA
ncbi:hypothetical protein ACKKBG_A33475 [Auxenochlorella protothecoides x Auxenochlorella symbiontica]